MITLLHPKMESDVTRFKVSFHC